MLDFQTHFQYSAGHKLSLLCVELLISKESSGSVQLLKD